MIVVELCREAIRNLARHKLRSFLTTLGITIGVASVIAMVSLGQSATASVNQDLQSLGQTLMWREKQAELLRIQLALQPVG